MSKFLCDVITSWRAECISLSFSLEKTALLIEETKLLSVHGSSELQKYCTFFAVVIRPDKAKFISGWWILQTYLFMEKVIFGLNLSWIKPFLHWSKQTIKVRNVYMCIGNTSVSSMNSDFNTPPSETDLFMYKRCGMKWQCLSPFKWKFKKHILTWGKWHFRLEINPLKSVIKYFNVNGSGLYSLSIHHCRITSI